jgi:hypothetical protein
MKSVVICPVCGREYQEELPDVGEGEPYETSCLCEHLLWVPRGTAMGEDDFLTFLNDFLRCHQKSIGVLELFRLDLDAIPRRALEANRSQLEALVNKRLHEVDGWYFGASEQIEKLCRELAGKLKELV